MIEFIVIAAMLVINGVFAAYELALASVSAGRLSVLAGRKAYGAEAALFMKERMEGSLALVQLAITLAGSVAAATGGSGVGEYFVPYLASRLGIGKAAAEVLGITLFVIPLSSFTIVFSELVPKMFAIENKESITLKLSPMMRVLYMLFHPLIGVFEKIVRLVTSGIRRLMRPSAAVNADEGLEDLWAATAHARSRNIIGLFEEKLANSAVLFSRRSVSDVLLPAQYVCCIPADASLSDALVRAHLDMHTRFPVVEKDGDFSTVSGYLNFKDIVTALRLNPSNPTVRGITRQIKSLEAAVSLSSALQQMMSENAHLAVVLENGAKRGIVTMEDIIEMLIGKIGDEYDSLPSYVHLSGETVMAGGGAGLAQVCLKLGIECREDEQLSRWAATRLGRAPRGGDVVKDAGLELWVRKTRRQNVVDAVVRRLA